MTKLVKYVVLLPIVFVLGCSQLQENNGVVKIQGTPVTKFANGTLNLVSFRTTPSWDLLDDNDKAWVLVLPDGKISFYPLSEVSSAPNLLSSLGTISSILPTPTIPVLP